MYVIRITYRYELHKKLRIFNVLNFLCVVYMIAWYLSMSKRLWNIKYSGTCELGTPKGLSKTVLNSEVVLFLRSIYMCWIDLGTEVAVLNSQVIPISQVVLKTDFTVLPKTIDVSYMSMIGPTNYPYYHFISSFRFVISFRHFVEYSKPIYEVHLTL